MKSLSAPTAAQLKVADEVWIATALLHREHPTLAEFSISEIVERAKKEEITAELRPGFRVHVTMHCVANRPPNPGRYKMLFATGKSSRRLFRPGDPFHPRREGAKTIPAREDIPPEYQDLLRWYETEYVPSPRPSGEEDPLLSLRGSGKALWADEHADQYVRRLREGWE